MIEKYRLGNGLEVKHLFAGALSRWAACELCQSGQGHRDRQLLPQEAPQEQVHGPMIV